MALELALLATQLMAASRAQMNPPYMLRCTYPTHHRAPAGSPWTDLRSRACVSVRRRTCDACLEAAGVGPTCALCLLIALLLAPALPSTPRSPKFACPVLLADHSTAVLTTNGTILVAGCDRCAKMRSNLPFSAPRAKAEYRNEIFYPPFWYDMDNKPRILTAASNVTYGQRFNVSYTGEKKPNVTVGTMVLGGDAECVTNVSDRFLKLMLRSSPLALCCCLQVTSAVFVAPSSTTHSFNMNQRVVKLVIWRSDPVLKTVELVVSGFTCQQ